MLNNFSYCFIIEIRFYFSLSLSFSSFVFFFCHFIFDSCWCNKFFITDFQSVFFFFIFFLLFVVVVLCVVHSTVFFHMNRAIGSHWRRNGSNQCRYARGREKLERHGKMLWFMCASLQKVSLIFFAVYKNEREEEKVDFLFCWFSLFLFSSVFFFLPSSSVSSLF